MRRIGTKHARLGMVLTRPVFDSRGYLLLEEGSEMNRQNLAILASRNVPEIFIEDSRTPDVVVKPVIAPEFESASVQALKELIAHVKKSGQFLSSQITRRRSQVIPFLRKVLRRSALALLRNA